MHILKKRSFCVLKALSEPENATYYILRWKMLHLCVHVYRRKSRLNTCAWGIHIDMTVP